MDGVGLDNYGECSLTARDDMIAHRATVFEENSVRFMERHKVAFAKAHNLPKGFRATWADRAELCVAKLAAAIDATTRPDDYSNLLLKPGRISDDDHFVEVHIGDR